MAVNGVSVVIAAYNAQDTLEATLASVLAQSRRPEEVLLADDASTDGTVAIAKRWLDRLPLRIIELPINAGVGPTRTAAINAASHDTIATLDADDVWLPDHLETLVPLMTSESVIVEALPVRWAPGLGIDSSGVGLSPQTPPADQQVEQVLLDNFLFVGSLFSKRALERSGGGSLRRTGEDWDCWIRLIVQGGCRVVPAPHATVLYRCSAGSVSSAEGCLPFEVVLVTDLLADPNYAQHRKVLQRALKRRRARTTFLQATGLSLAGNQTDVRCLYLRAISQDHSLRGGMGPGSQGSVALRSAIGLLSPRLAQSLRTRRLANKRIIQVELDESRFGPNSLTSSSSQRICA